MDMLLTLEIAQWWPLLDETLRQQLAWALELGKVLHCPRLAFEMSDEELALLTPLLLNGKRKNISLEGGSVRGARASPQTQQQLACMMGRFSEHATQLVRTLFPRYESHLHSARTSFRPALVDNRDLSATKDDSRLHVDAFPSRPNRGERILRVFCNINGSETPRRWRMGEPFEQAVQHFLPRIRRPLPGSAHLLSTLGITKGKRSEYDHIMLSLHNRMKLDAAYQHGAPQRTVDFPARSTWICFTDQVLHAAMSGQHLLEKTFLVPVTAQYHPEMSPLKVLERLCQRSLVA